MDQLLKVSSLPLPNLLVARAAKGLLLRMSRDTAQGASPTSGFTYLPGAWPVLFSQHFSSISRQTMSCNDSF